MPRPNWLRQLDRVQPPPAPPPQSDIGNVSLGIIVGVGFTFACIGLVTVIILIVRWLRG